MAAVRHTTTAQDMFTILRNRHQGSGMLAQIFARKAFNNCKRDRGEPLDAYVDRMRAKYNACRILNCPVTETEFAINLICGVGNEYESLVQGLSAQNTNLGDLSLSDIEQLFQAQALREGDKPHKAAKTEAVLVAGGDRLPKASRDPSPARKGRDKCTYPKCRRMGHLEKDCWIKHPELKEAWNESKRRKGDNVVPLSACLGIAHDREKMYFQQGSDITYSRHSREQTDPEESFLQTINGGSWSFATPGGRSLVIDLGATSHVTNDRSILRNIRKLKEPHAVYVGDGRPIWVKEVGTMHIRDKESRSTKTYKIPEVLYSEKFSGTLLSTGPMGEAGYETRLWGNEICIMEDSRRVQRPREILRGVQEKEGDRLYWLNAAPVVARQTSTLNTATTDKERNAGLWHAQLGHLGPDYMAKLTKIAKDYHPDLDSHAHCPTCKRGKATKESWPQTGGLGRSAAVLDRIHCNITPINHTSVGGGKLRASHRRLPHALGSYGVPEEKVRHATGNQGVGRRSRTKARPKAPYIPLRQWRGVCGRRI